jgi:hypothetical protein
LGIASLKDIIKKTLSNYLLKEFKVVGSIQLNLCTNKKTPYKDFSAFAA